MPARSYQYASYIKLIRGQPVLQLMNNQYSECLIKVVKSVIESFNLSTVLKNKNYQLPRYYSDIGKDWSTGENGGNV